MVNVIRFRVKCVLSTFNEEIIIAWLSEIIKIITLNPKCVLLYAAATLNCTLFPFSRMVRRGKRKMERIKKKHAKCCTHSKYMNENCNVFAHGTILNTRRFLTNLPINTENMCLVQMCMCMSIEHWAKVAIVNYNLYDHSKKVFRVEQLPSVRCVSKTTKVFHPKLFSKMGNWETKKTHKNWMKIESN